ncbi:MAG: YkgJ family cysteine cluster protein [Bosea sp. (in: a-proteobacteria)]
MTPDSPASSAHLDPAMQIAKPAPGRDCGTCTLCCKVFDVPSLNKSMGKWCQHCTPGRGCGIHETRPQHCRAFHCAWMTESWLGPEWKPERSKFVLTIDHVTHFLFAQVDPGSPNAWKAEPYYSQFKRWAQLATENGKHVIIFHNRSATFILPDRDESVGIIGADERIITRRRETPYGPRFDLMKVKGDPAQA